ncbi:hypothetical protein [Nocardia sp. NPDC127526]|uniref:hypothetical protein n=1 Tax=Nocardia sp. NPDC127526 TaxID=3345393 RepID=UPI0036336D67
MAGPAVWGRASAGVAIPGPGPGRLPRTEYRCTYAARQVAVKARYGLWVTPAERDALARILNSC